jgi:hypothetical protein
VIKLKLALKRGNAISEPFLDKRQVKKQHANAEHFWVKNRPSDSTGKKLPSLMGKSAFAVSWLLRHAS